MTIFLDAVPVAFLVLAPPAGGELQHCWQAVLARGGSPVLVGAAGPAAEGGGTGSPPDVQLPWAQPRDYAGIVLIRGTGPADVPADAAAARFLTGFFALGLPVAASAAAALDLAALDLVRGRRLAAPAMARQALAAARAVIVQERVVRCDNGPSVLITSSSAADLPAFCDAFTRAFGDRHGVRPRAALGS